jgi:hypothetical protein
MKPAMDDKAIGLVVLVYVYHCIISLLGSLVSTIEYNLVFVRSVDGLLVHAAEENLKTFMDGTYGGNLSGQLSFYFISMAYCSHSQSSIRCKKC